MKYWQVQTGLALAQTVTFYWVAIFCYCIMYWSCLLFIQAEVNYMDPENLEFADEPRSYTRRSIKEDRSVQYADLAGSPKYVNIV